MSAPTLIIHGQKDTLIPESHAIELHENCLGPSKLIMPENMSHNEYDVYTDLVKPIHQFFTETNVLTTLSQRFFVRQPHWQLTLPPACIIDKTPSDVRTQLAQLIKNTETKRILKL